MRARSTMKNAAGLLVVIAAMLFVFGCAKKTRPTRPSAASGEKYYAVTVGSAPFYTYGPQQANGPNRQLPRNTLLKLIQASFGYSKIKLLTGEEGYVATADIHSAPPSLVAAAFPTPTPIEATLPAAQSTPSLEPAPISDSSASPSTSPN